MFGMRSKSCPAQSAHSASPIYSRGSVRPLDANLSTLIAVIPAQAGIQFALVDRKPAARRAKRSISLNRPS